ncbi:unnamed protein product [Bursaphelenchus xylophilus]|uniref:(pine wood nematode) hypothetical protein n=1 Tax=Bursaphelenchus xylophilus TaxID=6326 RepID=A0A1I7RZQ9_BURXY|nr:unnamed protein product [Bursaphelenchus xylophilus]CAG9111570.1 unnamed protein product [Bursaphelenchus xylophilus]
MLLRVAFVLLLLFSLFVQPADAYRKGYMLRKGSKLEKQHRRSLHEWKKAHRHKHHKKRQSMEFEELLMKMDSFIRPRFG